MKFDNDSKFFELQGVFSSWNIEDEYKNLSCKHPSLGCFTSTLGYCSSKENSIKAIKIACSTMSVTCHDHLCYINLVPHYMDCEEFFGNTIFEYQYLPNGKSIGSNICTVDNGIESNRLREKGKCRHKYGEICWYIQPVNWQLIPCVIIGEPLSKEEYEKNLADGYPMFIDDFEYKILTLDNNHPGVISVSETMLMSENDFKYLIPQDIKYALKSKSQDEDLDLEENLSYNKKDAIKAFKNYKVGGSISALVFYIEISCSYGYMIKECKRKFLRLIEEHISEVDEEDMAIVRKFSKMWGVE